MLALRMVNMGIRRQIEAFRNQNGLDAAAGTNGWVLGFLSEHESEDIYQRDLEKELGVCRSGVSKTVAALENENWGQLADESLAVRLPTGAAFQVDLRQAGAVLVMAVGVLYLFTYIKQLKTA